LRKSILEGNCFKTRKFKGEFENEQKFLAGFLCAVMALGVAGCGGGDKKQPMVQVELKLNQLLEDERYYC